MAAVSQAPWPIWQRLGHARERISELHVLCLFSASSSVARGRDSITAGSPPSNLMAGTADRDRHARDDVEPSVCVHSIHSTSVSRISPTLGPLHAAPQAAVYPQDQRCTWRRPSGDRCGGGRRLLAMAVARGVRRGGGFVCVCTRLLGREAASRSSSTMWGPIPCSHTPNGLQFILLLRVSTYSYFCATGGNLPSTPDDTPACEE